MSCVVRTNRREDLAVRGTLNSFRLLHPLFALQGILDHLPNRPRRHTCALQTLLNPVRAGKPPPNTPGPSRKPLEPSSIVSEQGVKRSRIKKLMIPMPQHPSQDARVLHGLQRAPISTPPAVDLMPSPARAEDSRKPLKCRQRHRMASKELGVCSAGQGDERRLCICTSHIVSLFANFRRGKSKQVEHAPTHLFS